jgi:hypothetical protein
LRRFLPSSRRASIVQHLLICIADQAFKNSIWFIRVNDLVVLNQGCKEFRQVSGVAAPGIRGASAIPNPNNDFFAD